MASAHRTVKWEPSSFGSVLKLIISNIQVDFWNENLLDKDLSQPIF